MKITVICGTNRINSYSEKIALYYVNLLKEKGCDVQYLSMKEIENVITLSDYFNKENAQRERLIEKYIAGTNAFIFIVPEYNGSLPGILKLFLDTIHPRNWENKYACITGIASGRAGNLRGIEHLTGILNYLKMHVYHNKLPVSQVDKIFEKTVPTSEETVKVIMNQLVGFLAFAKDTFH